MASAAQVRANRANARKSTGPRTAAGKERASQNAVKHGLLAREAVIAGEDPEEFEIYRAQMLEELAPAGPVEAMLAERVVGLSWRLRRAERLQNAAFAALDDGTPTPLLDARLEEWKRLKGSQADRSSCGVVEDEFALGRVVVEDFTRARVLDRLLLYERRIESSLYRTMAELRKKQEARQASAAAVTPEEASRSEPRLQAGQEPVTLTELGSFGGNAMAGSPATSLSGETLAVNTRNSHGQACPERSERDAHATHGQDARATETPDGVTTNITAAGVTPHSHIPAFRDSRSAAEMPVEEQSCETNLIWGDPDDDRVARGARAADGQSRGEIAETKPISPASL